MHRAIYSFGFPIILRLLLVLAQKISRWKKPCVISAIVGTELDIKLSADTGVQSYQSLWCRHEKNAHIFFSQSGTPRLDSPSLLGLLGRQLRGFRVNGAPLIFF